MLAFPIILAWRSPRCKPCCPQRHADRYAAIVGEVPPLRDRQDTATSSASRPSPTQRCQKTGDTSGRSPPGRYRSESRHYTDRFGIVWRVSDWTVIDACIGWQSFRDSGLPMDAKVPRRPLIHEPRNPVCRFCPSPSFCAPCCAETRFRCPDPWLGGRARPPAGALPATGASILGTSILGKTAFSHMSGEV